MEPSDRDPHSPRHGDAGTEGERRSPVLAFVEIQVDLLRKNERDLAPDELSDEEADAFGYC